VRFFNFPAAYSSFPNGVVGNPELKAVFLMDSGQNHAGMTMSVGNYFAVGVSNS
jgi:hypothetical protein